MNGQMATDRAQTMERVAARRVVRPHVDVYENKEELLILADLPGVNRDAVAVHLEAGQLTIEARRVESIPGREKETVEFDYQRVFAVPKGIEASKIDAELRSGVLRLRLPKAEPLKPRRIEVKSA